MTALVVGLTVAVALLGLIVLGLLRAHAEVLRALHEMGIDLDPAQPAAKHANPANPADHRPASSAVHLTTRPTPARPDPDAVVDLTGTTPAGDAVSLAVAGVRHDTLVAFLTSGCVTCRGFWDAFRSGPPEVPGGARLVVVTRGADAESPGAVAALSGSTPVVMSTELWESYDIPYAPYFVYISGPAGRVVGEGVAAGWDEVKALVANAVADGTTTPPAATASTAPTGPLGPTGRPRSRADRLRDDAVDRQLQAAGIDPGDPRLYPASIHSGPPQ